MSETVNSTSATHPEIAGLIAQRASLAASLTQRKAFVETLPKGSEDAKNHGDGIKTEERHLKDIEKRIKLLAPDLVLEPVFAPVSAVETPTPAKKSGAAKS